MQSFDLFQIELQHSGSHILKHADDLATQVGHFTSLVVALVLVVFGIESS